jgi:outer membrane receptor protein involved in Fe transport
VDVGSWNLGGSVVYTNLGKAVYGLAQPGEIFGYDQWDLRISLANPARKSLPKVTLEVTNLNDERGITNSFSGATYTDVTYLQPRAVTLRLTGEF